MFKNSRYFEKFLQRFLTPSKALKDIKNKDNEGTS